MTSSIEHYQGVLDDTFDTESLTIFIVAGAPREEVTEALQIDTSAAPSDDGYVDDADVSAYALADIEGGVVRDNIKAHLRFGSARDGAIVFDAHEYTWVDKELVPAELRELFDTAWFDPDAPIENMEHNGFAIGLAMAEVITGLRLTADDLTRAGAAGYRPAPCFLYVLGLQED